MHRGPQPHARADDREFLQIYPHARVLAACSDDLTRDRRRLFIAKIAANDWDAIIITGSAFARIPIGLDFQKEYLGKEIARHPTGAPGQGGRR